MHQRSLLLDHPEPRSQTMTTFWHGNVAAATWTHRNIASVTENGVADVTLTFQQAYQATPCAIVSGGETTNLQGGFSAMTASSIRVITMNSSGTATVGRKSSVICVGDI